MASFYNLNERITGYIVKVTSTQRGRKVIVKREFSAAEYDNALYFADLMEGEYGHGYIVSFDTTFR